MKKIISILSVALALVACSKSGLQTEYQSIPAPDELYGAIAGQNDDGTKAYFVGPFISGDNVYYPHFWEVGDDISVFWENTQNRLYRCYNDISNDNTKSTVNYSKFGKLESLALGDASSIGNVRYCIHPFDYRNAVDNSGKVVTFYVPEEQTYRSVEHAYTHPAGSKTVSSISYGTGKFQYDGSTSYNSNGCAVFVAMNTEPITGHYNYFNFYNVGCWLKLIIKSNEEFTLGRIELTGNKGQALAGSASTSFKVKTDEKGVNYHYLDDKTNISRVGNGPTKVTLYGDDTKKINSTASEFYIYLLPTEFFSPSNADENGFTLKIFDKGGNLKGTAVAKSKDNEGDIGKEEVFKRNRVVRMSDWELTELKFAVLTVREWTNVEETINFE